MSALIETKGLSKHFAEIKAVDDISFSVSKGDVLGFLGPNGAGKSTTMKMLTCFLEPSGGQAFIAGKNVQEQPREVRKLFGYLPESAPLYGEMSVNDFLKFIAEIRQVDSIKDSIERVVELTNLHGVTTQRVETLSKGYKRRVGLAQALIHDPEILILDEPTDGLDPNQKHDVRELIRSMSKDKCILLSTHILEEVEEVCNRVIVIAKGKLVADGVPDELRRRSSLHGTVKIVVKKTETSVYEKLNAVDGISKIVKEEREGLESFTVFPKNNAESIVYSLLEEAKRENWSLEDFQIERGRLDDVFREITKE